MSFPLSLGSPNIRVVLSVWPPGSTIYLRESVALRCSVEAGANYSWTYHWFRHTSHKLVTPNARHMISGDGYSITGVAKADGGSYWCRAERNGSTTPLLSDPAHLTVSGETTFSLITVHWLVVTPTYCTHLSRRADPTLFGSDPQQPTALPRGALLSPVPCCVWEQLHRE